MDFFILFIVCLFFIIFLFISDKIGEYGYDIMLIYMGIIVFIMIISGIGVILSLCMILLISIFDIIFK